MMQSRPLGLICSRNRVDAGLHHLMTGWYAVTISNTDIKIRVSMGDDVSL